MKKSSASSSSSKKVSANPAAGSKAEQRETAKKNAREILIYMELARSGEKEAVDWVQLHSRLPEYKLDVEACRLAYCMKLGIDPTTPLRRLLANLPEPQMHRRQAVSDSGFSQVWTTSKPQRAGYCSQCDHPAIPGDDRCYLHIK